MRVAAAAVVLSGGGVIKVFVMHARNWSGMASGHTGGARKKSNRKNFAPVANTIPFLLMSIARS